MALFFYKEKNKDIRAAAYLRLSIEDGDKAESNSIGNQRELIRDFAAERPGLHLIEEYADDGYTGTNFERPGFKRMMEDIKSGKINCIIVKDLSRLGRNYIEMGKYLEQIFPMMGIRFIAINDNYDNHCSAWFFYLLGSVLLATAILSYLMHQSQGMEALQMLIGGFVIFMIPQVVGGVVVLLELAAVMLR